MRTDTRSVMLSKFKVKSVGGGSFQTHFYHNRKLRAGTDIYHLSLNINNTMHHQRKNPHEISNTVRVKAINLYPTCRSLQAF